MILQERPYCAVVTFFPMEDVREHLKECVFAAVLAAYRNESGSDQVHRPLTHVNQRFRFNYVLGNGPVKDTTDFDDDGNGDIAVESGDLLKRIATHIQQNEDGLSNAFAALDPDATKRVLPVPGHFPCYATHRAASSRILSASAPSRGVSSGRISGSCSAAAAPRNEMHAVS